MTIFDNIKWPDGEALTAKFCARGSAGVSFRNCYVGFSGWTVKLFLGGCQRVLCSTRNGVNAARFADMSIVHFHPYRKRRVRPLIDADLNFSLAQAASDKLNVPEAQQLIEDLERSLIARNLIPAIPTPPAGEPPMRPDVLRVSLALQHQKLSNLFSHFKQRFGNHPMASAHVAEFDNTLDRLRIQIRSLDTFFLEPDPNTPTTTTTP